MKRYITLTALILALAVSAFGNDLNWLVCSPPLVVLSGQVTRADNGNPIEGAQLTLTSIATSTVCGTSLSSPFGYYSFDPVFTASFIVTASKKGCTQYVNNVSMPDNVTLNIALECD